MPTSDYYSIAKRNDTSYVFGAYDNSTNYYCFGVFFTNYTVLLINIKNQNCDNSQLVGFTEGYITFFITRRTYDLYYQTYQALNEKWTNLYKGSIGTFSQGNSGRLQFINWEGDNGLLCGFFPTLANVKCHAITLKNTTTPTTGTVVGVLTNCDINYENQFLLYKMNREKALVACQGVPFQIQVLSYDFTNKVYYSLASPIEIQDTNYIYYDLSFLSEYRFMLIGIENINTEYNYYAKIMGISFDDISTEQEGLDGFFAFYLNGNKYYPCYDTCYKCSQKGDSTNNNCLNCKKGTYPFEDIPSNCAPIGEEGADHIFNPIDEEFALCSLYFFIDSNTFYCSKCTAKYKFLIPSMRRCVMHCVEFSLLEYKAECVEVCPDDSFMIDNAVCEIFISSSNAPVIVSVSKETIVKNLNDNVLKLSNSSIIKGSNFTLHIYNDSLEQRIDGLSSLNITRCKEILKKTYGIPDDLIVAKIDTANSSSVTPQVEYAIYDSGGNKLDLSLCDSQGGVDIKYPILNFDLANLTFAEEMMVKYGVDVYNRLDPFFEDACYPFSNGKADIGLKDRVKDFYMDVKLCDANCIYEGVNFTDGTVNCNCYTEEKTQKEDFFTETFIYSTNLPLFKCFEQAINKKNIKDSIGVYFYTSMIFLQILCVAIFISCNGFDGVFSKLFKGYIETYNDCVTSEKDTTQSTPSAQPLNRPSLSLIIHNSDIDSTIYSEAFKNETRNAFQFFISLLITKVDLIAVFFSLGEYDLFIISLSIFFFSLSTDFFMNALLFSDEIISERYANEGNLSTLSTLILTVFSDALSFILVYIVTKLTYYAPPLEILSQNSQGRRTIYKNLGKVMMLIKCKTYIYFCVVFLLTPLYLYFLSSFCAVYHASWFSNSFLSFVISLISSFAMTFMVTALRFFGLWVQSEKIYNMSLYLNR